jgi:site-specific DNA-methyltransferase (adenine-specific)
MKGGYMNKSLTDEWGTPIGLYVGMCKEFDIMPELDVCATPTNSKCEKFYDKNIDGLTQEWSCDFFMNPPFSKAKFWIQKAFEEHRKYNVNGMAVLAARTDTKAWHNFILNQANCEVMFVQGRVKYLLPDNSESLNPSTFPTALVIWRKFD